MALYDLQVNRIKRDIVAIGGPELEAKQLRKVWEYLQLNNSKFREFEARVQDRQLLENLAIAVRKHRDQEKGLGL